MTVDAAERRSTWILASPAVFWRSSSSAGRWKSNDKDFPIEGSDMPLRKWGDFAITRTLLAEYPPRMHHWLIWLHCRRTWNAGSFCERPPPASSLDEQTINNKYDRRLLGAFTFIVRWIFIARLQTDALGNIAKDPVRYVIYLVPFAQRDIVLPFLFVRLSSLCNTDHLYFVTVLHYFCGYDFTRNELHFIISCTFTVTSVTSSVYFFMPLPLIGGGIKRWCCLTSVWRLSRTSGLCREQRGLGRLKLLAQR